MNPKLSAALWGRLLDPGMGLPPAAGAHIEDDFIASAAEIVAARYGDALWVNNTIGGAATYASQAPTTYTEVGVLRMTTPAVINQGSTLTKGVTAPFYRIPPPGSVWAAKIRMVTGTTGYELWTGFSSSTTGRVQAADATDFIGIRSNGGNLTGVVKQAAATETTQDLGFDCEGSTWRIVGFEVKGTTTTPSVQFFYLDCSRNDFFSRVDVGAPITTTIPNTTMRPLALGLINTDAAAKAGEIDFWAFGSRAAR